MQRGFARACLGHGAAQRTHTYAPQAHIMCYQRSAPRAWCSSASRCAAAAAERGLSSLRASYAGFSDTLVNARRMCACAARGTSNCEKRLRSTK